MPCSWTLYGWMRHRPAFARAVREAEPFRDMMLADQALEVVDAMTAAGWQADVNRLSALRLRAGQLSAGARRRD
jgi:ABC-type nitrate/sulfonate/bicarbonate transport system ATPase subunit